MGSALHRDEGGRGDEGGWHAATVREAGTDDTWGTVRLADSVDMGPEVWVGAALHACHASWHRLGRRYERRLAERALARAALDDVMTLTARRLVPLAREVQRPLPPTAEPLERAFNRLDRNDRRVLRMLPLLEAGAGPEVEHLASALHRFLESMRRSLQP